MAFRHCPLSSCRHTKSRVEYLFYHKTMLTELRVRDFAIIDTLDLEFARGLNVITGETGAGKSILIDSIALLLGDKAKANMVRAGAERASIEGTFNVPPKNAARLSEILNTHELTLDDNHVTLACEVRANGRSVCRVNGSAVSQSVLREIGECLVDVHGQSEHLSLLRVREHINLLDDFAGTWDMRKQVGAKVGELRATEKQRAQIEHNAREQARRVDMLKFQLEEIQQAKLKPNEEAALQEEHLRLANAESIAEAANEATTLLYESGERGRLSALDQLAKAQHALVTLARFDTQFDDYAKSLNEASAIVNEVARSIAEYRDNIEFNPKRLDIVESRLEAIKKLKRKYGDSVETILAFAENAAHELDQLENSEERIAELKSREEALRADADAIAKTLTQKRQSAAKKLASGIEKELLDLKMSGAKFAVQIAPKALDMNGADSVEFMIAPNLGEGLKPLVQIASGGETARLMLALKAVLARSDSNSAPTLIFDEIDQGIGGRVGTIVGHKLWSLTKAHQVLCITHLPQLASFGDAHFKVEKQQVDKRTRTLTTHLDTRQRIEELALMLGTSGETGAKGAEQLLNEAQELKKAA